MEFDLGKTKRKRKPEPTGNVKTLRIARLTASILNTHRPHSSGLDGLKTILGRFDAAEKIVVGGTGNSLGVYRNTTDQIFIRSSQLKDEHEWITVLHELAHMAGYHLKSRWYVMYHHFSDHKAMEEMIVDLAAIALWNKYGGHYEGREEDAIDRMIQCLLKQKIKRLFDSSRDAIEFGAMERVEWIEGFLDDAARVAANKDVGA